MLILRIMIVMNRLQAQLKDINTRDPKQYEIKDKFSDHMPLMSKVSALVQASSNNGLTYNVIGNSSYCTRYVAGAYVCMWLWRLNVLLSEFFV